MASPSSLCQRFPYAHFNAMVTKISKWSRIQDSCRITPKIESLVVYAMPDIPSKFQKYPSITLSYLADTQTNKQTNKRTNRQTKTGKNITSLVKVIKTEQLTIHICGTGVSLIRHCTHCCQRFGSWQTLCGSLSCLHCLNAAWHVRQQLSSCLLWCVACDLLCHSQGLCHKMDTKGH